jgi:hypothetical protein
MKTAECGPIFNLYKRNLRHTNLVFSDNMHGIEDPLRANVQNSEYVGRNIV